MTNGEKTREVESVEEYTLYTLDRSTEGLQEMQNLCVLSAQDLAQGDMVSFTERFRILADQLDAFQGFLFELSTLFQLEAEDCSAGGERLETLRAEYEQNLLLIGTLLDERRLAGLHGILHGRLPEILQDIQTLLPSLREHIHQEYLQPA